MEINREITVKGIGSLSAKVDYITVIFTLDELNRVYKSGYEDFNSHISALQNIIEKLGFEKSDLKTSAISITTKYDSVKRNGDYVEIFAGYRFTTKMKLSFDFDSEKLGKVFASISEMDFAPKVNVIFSVKDEEFVKNQLLANAAKDARTKAQVLSEAMGVKLGKLITIQYNWDVIEIQSRTSYDFAATGRIKGSREIDFTPEDISLEDEAAFIWEIED